MALPSVSLFPRGILPSLPNATPISLKLASNVHLPCQVRSMTNNRVRSMTNNRVLIDQTITRPSGNWTPPVFDYDLVQSLTSEYVGEAHAERANKLIANVRSTLQRTSNRHDQLELIDVLQRIGLAYHFEDDIRSALEKMFNNTCRPDIQAQEDLYDIALEFRLLRHNGYVLPQEVFNNFIDEKGNFKTSLGDDIKGMLNLYEASYLLVEDESILENARDFAAKHLKEYSKQIGEDQYLSMLVNHALELPLHWRMPRMEARWFINVYEKKKGYDPTILELAKLDFNMVQAKHQDEIRDSSRWWNNLDLGEKLSYTRERNMENVFYAVGEQWEPRFGHYRKMESRVNALITSLDDAYDVYCTLDEVEILTETIDGWDLNEVERLPPFLKILFLALFNTINEMAYFIMTQTRINAVPVLKKLWGDLSRAYLQEAKWFYSGYTPTLKEYLENAWLSISGHVALGHAFLYVSNPLTPALVKCYMESEYPNAVRFSSIIFRLLNDLGTSSDEITRGDVPKSLQCYMHETGATEEEAREHIRFLIRETWKKLNKEKFAASPFSQTFMETTLNLARTAQCCYEYGDGYGIQNNESKDRLFSLFVHPVK